MIDAQLDLFEREHRDVIEEVDARLDAYNAAERDEAEELYGDYVDAVETGTEILADMRDHYARSLDDPDAYLREFNSAVGEAAARVRARDRESVVAERIEDYALVGDLQTAALDRPRGLDRLALLPALRLGLVLRRAARHARQRPLAASRPPRAGLRPRAATATNTLDPGERVADVDRAACG